jgi:phospholipase/carboxylesterase
MSPLSPAVKFVQVGAVLDAAAVVCVVVHGRGQTPEDMIDQIVNRLNVSGVCYLLPAAPDRAWYGARAVDPMTATTREQLETSLGVLQALMTEVSGKGKPVLLAGFSQGACLSMEYAFSHGRWDGALVCLTGCRVGRAQDDRSRSALGGMPVYLTGADADPWIPVDAFAEAAGAFGAAGARLRCDVLPGRAHEVSGAEIDVVSNMLAALAAGAEVWA